MKYECPRCDKQLRQDEIDNKRCSNCGLEFKITENTDVAMIKEKQMLRKLAKEVFGVKNNKIDCYETAINLLKSVFLNVVHTRGDRFVTFYKVVDGEIKYFLFRLDKIKSKIRVEFDINLRYKNITRYSLEERKRRKLGRIKCCLSTNDFDFLMEVCNAVSERKNRLYGNSVRPVDILVKY